MRSHDAAGHRTDERWWADRKQWFFKPAGFGSRGTYRGDKITRRVFGDVMRGNYIAQSSRRPAKRRGTSRTRELQTRCAQLRVRRVQQLLAARLYQGQTTNSARRAAASRPCIYSTTPRLVQGPRTSPRGCTRPR